MKMILALITLLAVGAAHSKEIVLGEASYEKSGIHHKFAIRQNLKTNEYLLSFTDGKKKKTQTKKLKKMAAVILLDKSTFIIWNSKGRMPAQARCTPYARFSDASGETQVCLENKKVIGKAYAYLGKLRSYFPEK